MSKTCLLRIIFISFVAIAIKKLYLEDRKKCERFSFFFVLPFACNWMGFYCEIKLTWLEWTSIVKSKEYVYTCFLLFRTEDFSKNLQIKLKLKKKFIAIV